MRLKRVGGQIQQIPNGLKFRQSQINWDSTKVLGLHPSWDSLVTAVMSARRANPHHASKNKWALDRAGVEHDVEQYNVRLCQANGWTQHIADSGGGGAPFPSSQSLPDQKQLGAAVKSVRKLWAGLKTLNEWLDSGEPPVETELAEKRAATCVACPMNGKGDFTSWFTKPAASVIQKQIERLQERKITGTLDEQLGVCSGCLCPNRLKTKTPMKFIKPHLSTEVIDELRNGKDCWIISEMGV